MKWWLTIELLLIVLIDVFHLGIDIWINTQILRWLVERAISIDTLNPEALLLLDDVREHSLKPQTTRGQVFDHVVLLDLSVAILALLVRI